MTMNTVPSRKLRDNLYALKCGSYKLISCIRNTCYEKKVVVLRPRDIVNSWSEWMEAVYDNDYKRQEVSIYPKAVRQYPIEDYLQPDNTMNVNKLRELLDDNTEVVLFDELDMFFTTTDTAASLIESLGELSLYCKVYMNKCKNEILEELYDHEHAP